MTKENSQNKKEKPLYILVCIVLLCILVLSVVTAVMIGTVEISAKDVYGVIFHEIFGSQSTVQYAKGAVHDVVWLIRLPRIILAAAVGAGLAVCGIAMQAVIKNPLADPYIMGISSGASLGATLAVMLGVGTAFGQNYVGIVAFAGAFGVSVLVVVIANIGSRANTVKLLLAGMAISSACSSVSSFIVFFANDRDRLQRVTFWLMGSLAGAKWEQNAVVFIIVTAGTLFFMTQYRTLNMMLLGDEVSVTLGTDLHKYRHVYLLVTSFMIGFIVYSSGMIGFVGLIIPHFIRMLFGTDHKKIIPVAALSGSVFLIWADVLSRIVVRNTEVPIGMLVSAVGAPCFVYLLVKRSYGFGGAN